MEIEPLPPICGIVMPISPIDSCSAEHWRDVKAILHEAIEDAGYVPQLVSDAEEVGIIQKRIIQNLYENPIVVVDVSAKNPNVMFELGMRLAFDRPTVIVKDDKTSYSFDTSPVEHLTYPRDLRFAQIVEFKEALAEKIRATCDKAKSDPNYTTFLKHFGTFKVAELKTELVPQDRMVLEELRGLRELVGKLSAGVKNIETEAAPFVSTRTLCLQQQDDATADALEQTFFQAGFSPRRAKSGSNRHTHFRFTDLGTEERRKILELARRQVPEARWLNGPSMRPADA